VFFVMRSIDRGRDARAMRDNRRRQPRAVANDRRSSKPNRPNARRRPCRAAVRELKSCQSEIDTCTPPNRNLQSCKPQRPAELR
jgi:hypothetical protein